MRTQKRESGGYLREGLAIGRGYQGGDAFGASVRALLKPTNLLGVLQLPLNQALFPNMLSGAIRAIVTRYEYGDTNSSAPASFILDMGQQVPLADGKSVDTSGLTVRVSGTILSLKVKGDKSSLRKMST